MCAGVGVNWVVCGWGYNMQKKVKKWKGLDKSVVQG